MGKLICNEQTQQNTDFMQFHVVKFVRNRVNMLPLKSLHSYKHIGIGLLNIVTVIIIEIFILIGLYVVICNFILLP